MTKAESWKVMGKFEKLVSTGKMEWQPCDTSKLDQFGQSILKFWRDAGIKEFQIGKTIIKKCYVIKIDDPFVQYIDIDPTNQFYNCCYDNHRENRHPDTVLIYLLSKQNPKAKHQCVVHEDGTSTIIVEEKGKPKLIVNDLRKR